MELRPYQQAMVEAARGEARKGKRAILLVAPTGAGKTHILAANLSSFLQKNEDGVALYVVHRRVLVEQTKAVLEKLGINAGVVMHGYTTEWKHRVFVVSRDTWERRKEWLNFGTDVKLIIFDEAHIGISAQKRMVKALKPQYVLGYTATPISLSGPGMGALYEALVEGPTYLELIGQGYLVPTRWAVARRLDTSGLKVSEATGDYDIRDVERVVKG
ncbi:MAG: DEAD/DEAH box helicase family protein, partial [Hydrogenophilus sp.]|nr:DEAD/DEAH box helicase family protein [Hydrogenophilus sp.]